MSRGPLKPGNEAPKTGNYPVVGPKGGDTGQTVHVPKGHVMPPTQKPGMTYKPPTGKK